MNEQKKCNASKQKMLKVQLLPDNISVLLERWCVLLLARNIQIRHKKGNVAKESEIDKSIDRVVVLKKEIATFLSVGG